MQKQYLEGGGWRVVYDSGHVLYRWIDYAAERAMRARKSLWDVVSVDPICPKCGSWHPKDPDHWPVSCPMCKRYLQQSRAPRPDGYEVVTPGEWRRARLLHVDYPDGK